MAGSVAGAKPSPEDGQTYPGSRFGLPETGPRSVTSMGRRLLALLIDWFVSEIIAVGIFRVLHPSEPLFGHAYYQTTNLLTILIFAAETYLLTATTGITLGKRLLGIRVARLDGRPVGFGWALVRTVLLLAVVPPLISDRDLRGLHDRAANTIVLRL